MQHLSTDRRHLMQKTISILITNICNRTCGGCSQLCGHIPKEKLWNIPIDQLKSNIELCIKHNVQFALFGGEPTIHPLWEKIKEMLYEFAPLEITVFTNCVTKEVEHKNIKLLGDPMPNKYKRTFFPTAVAAIDVLPQETDFWKLAQDNCLMWHNCHSIIYNNKAYFCEIAGSMDWLLNNGENGWALNENHPMDHSDDEIAQQANIFCKRCGWCIPKEQRPVQEIKGPSLVSKSNLDLLTIGKRKSFPIINNE